MRISKSCESCLFDKQRHLSDDPEYLNEVRNLLNTRNDEDTAPYMVYLFTEAYKKRFGKKGDYSSIKREYNDLILSMEDEIREMIYEDKDPLLKSLCLARVGNYIDFGAMNHVDHNTFISLLRESSFSKDDLKIYDHFKTSLSIAQSFLLLADNCGEIVFDKLLIEVIKKFYPDIDITVMVRGEDVLNDATRQDAIYIGLDKIAHIVDNGKPVAGIIMSYLPEESKEVFNKADIILSKGQGNYESLSHQGYSIYYLFLCKCDHFTSRFHVPPLTGMFVEEK